MARLVPGSIVLTEMGASGLELIVGRSLVGNEPSVWFAEAEDLLLAAAAIEERAKPIDTTAEPLLEITAHLIGPLLMLRGCAIECALKSLFLLSGGQLFVGGKLRQPTVALKAQSHNLVEWARAASPALLLDEQDERLLNWLSHFIERGRYPVTKRDPDRAGRTAVWSKGDEELFWTLVERLWRAVRALTDTGAAAQTSTE